ncbi:UPF0061-domain-containing protein [Laetiporus sulphureus 93-53]|uniref:Selenoprotein O n=1 Tax=Laetiporus sulphureus 93-53 TaxID=1314785 RepID=A0A165ES39_9APHY|nr:UPF0061-domain-containing protein [Laetiporus sulphureus 93-53]KZT07649.1 UPF0061-domain-containing protein [Laetiporus sulphureus 93-53]
MSTIVPALRKMSRPNSVPISALPLPPPTHVLARNLTPDPEVSSTAEFRQVLSERPSILRRTRLLQPQAHFSYVAPCPIPFPYQIAAPEDGEPVTDKAAYIEKWLIEREALQERPTAPSPVPGRLKKYYPAKREQPQVLVALAGTALRDCVPHLDVGDAFAMLGTPSLVSALDDDVEPSSAREEEVAVRQELIDVLGGQAMLMNVEGDPETHWAPWSLRYSGHQFGTWAGQLGDGRAISLLTTPHPDDPELLYELQLKGAGRTPFSRFADGLAVLRSSIREFLCSEAMHALGIPTTRALSLVSLPAVPVYRERTESACVLARVAPSFLRIGNFEALNPPFLGSGQQEPHLDALRVLGEWVARRVLKLEGIKWRGEEGEEGNPWAREMVLEVARRNARMVAGWQAYGFMHGVINTDNVSILGFTIDYGPYSFMDVFDSFHICNHDDGEGRIYALRALLNALSPLIGAEAERGKAVPPGWADDVPEEKLDELRKQGMELVNDEMVRIAQETCAAEYARLMHKRLGLRRLQEDDEATLFRPLLDLLSEHKLDFHGSFRRLAFFRPSITDDPRNALISSILALSGEPQNLDREKATHDLRAWLRLYGERIEGEREEWTRGSELQNGDREADVDAQRERTMKEANPRFVLRQWVLEEVIKNVERDVDDGKHLLAKVLQMACKPFEPWGAEDLQGDESTLDAEIKEERRYCSLGDRKLLGFQCSCSS